MRLPDTAVVVTPQYDRVRDRLSEKLTGRGVSLEEDLPPEIAHAHAHGNVYVYVYVDVDVDVYVDVYGTAL